MKLHPFLTLLTGSLALCGPLHATLSDQLYAYYDFEQTGAPGLANKVPGATGTDATRYAIAPAEPVPFDSSENPSGPGFAGMSTFTSAKGTSDRSTLLVGKALNLSDDREDSIQLPYGPTQLGANFSISAWHYLAPGSTSASARFHVFESSDTGVYDISWGTTATSRVNFLGYINTGSSVPANGLAQNAWHHVVHTFSSDGTTTTMTVYVDGTYRGVLTAPTAALVFAKINVGRARDGTSGRNWDGMIDELGVWKKALTLREVTELNARGRGGVGITTDLASVNKFYLEVVSATPTLGTVTGSGLYSLNDVAAISTTSNPGYMLASWSGPFGGMAASFNHTVTGSLSADATFGPDTADTDGDGLTNYQEVVTYLTDPALADTDGDGLPDGVEVTVTGTSPKVSDATLVNFVNTQFLGAPLGTLDLATGGFTRDAQTGTLSFSLKAQVSTDDVTYTPQPFDAPGASITPDGNGVRVSLPAAAGAPQFYRLLVK